MRVLCLLSLQCLLPKAHMPQSRWPVVILLACIRFQSRWRDHDDRVTGKMSYRGGRATIFCGAPACEPYCAGSFAVRQYVDPVQDANTSLYSACPLLFTRLEVSSIHIVSVSLCASAACSCSVRRPANLFASSTGGFC